MLTNSVVTKTILSWLLISATSFGATKLAVTEHDIGDNPEVTDRIDSLPDLQLRDPVGDWESALTNAGKTSVNRILAAVPSALIGVAIRQFDGKDVLVSAWRTETPGFSKIWVLDEPDYNWLVLECGPQELGSIEAVKDFITKAIAWDPSGLPLARLDLVLSKGFGRFLVAGVGRIDPPYPYGGEISIYIIRSGGGFTVLLQAGKQLFSGYPAEARYVPERFPPLSSRVPTWGKSQVVAEIGKMRSLPGPIGHFTNRDDILIQELVARGVTDADLESLMSPPTGEWDDTYGNRVNSTIKAVVKSGAMEAHRLAIEKLVRKIGAEDRDDNRTALESIFRILRDQVKDDYTDLAVACLKACAMTAGPLMYLNERASTETAYSAIQGASVPREWEWLRTSALQAIRRRVSERVGK